MIRNHVIDPILGTPARDHNIFPHFNGAKKKQLASIRLRLTGAERSITSGSWSNEKTAAKVPKSSETTSNMSFVGDGDSMNACSDHSTFLQEQNITNSMSSKRISVINQFTSSNDMKNRSFNLQNNSSLNWRKYSHKWQNSDVDVMENQCTLENEMENR